MARTKEYIPVRAISVTYKLFLTKNEKNLFVMRTIYTIFALKYFTYQQYIYLY